IIPVAGNRRHLAKPNAEASPFYLTMIVWKVQCFFCNPGLTSAWICRRREAAEWRKTLVAGA
ncbi:MAG: hypothetical protein O6831_05975, partial [Alphaproteobacteria bacterium]|nr:hypothetical protein [Alphaproteobacteria bacterium]